MAAAGSDYDKLRELTATLDELNAVYEALVERWSYLTRNSRIISIGGNIQ